MWVPCMFRRRIPREQGSFLLRIMTKIDSPLLDRLREAGNRVVSPQLQCGLRADRISRSRRNRALLAAADNARRLRARLLPAGMPICQRYVSGKARSKNRLTAASSRISSKRRDKSHCARTSRIAFVERGIRTQHGDIEAIIQFIAIRCNTFVLKLKFAADVGDWISFASGSQQA